jgi:hypothetical protein
LEELARIARNSPVSIDPSAGRVCVAANTAKSREPFSLSVARRRYSRADRRRSFSGAIRRAEIPQCNRAGGDVHVDAICKRSRHPLSVPFHVGR